MKRLSLVVFLLIVCLLLNSFMPVHATNEAIILKQQFKEGQSFNLVDLVQFQVRSGEGENAVITNTKTGMGYLCQIEKLTPAGDSVVNLQIHSLYYEIPGALGQINIFDSSDPFALPDQYTIPLSYLVGDEIKLELNSQGRVKNVRFSEAFFDKLVQYFQSNKLKIKREMLETMLVETVKARMEQDANVPEQGAFPNKPVTVGESWEQEIETEHNGIRLTHKATYTLKQRRAGIAYIELDSKLIAVKPGDDKALQYVNFSGGMKGLIEIAEDSGWICAYNIKLKFDGELVATNPEPEVKSAAKSQAVQKSPFSLVGTLIRQPYASD